MCVSEQTWIQWRTKLGCRKGEAKALYREYLDLLADQSTPVRCLTFRHGETWEQALNAFLDQMPRRPTRFLAMVAAIEARRAAQAVIASQRAVKRRRYERRYQRIGNLM